MGYKEMAELFSKRDQLTTEEIVRAYFGEDLLKLLETEARLADKRIKKKWEKLNKKRKVPSVKVAVEKYLTNLAIVAAKKVEEKEDIKLTPIGGLFEKKVYKRFATEEEEMSALRRTAERQIRELEKLKKMLMHSSTKNLADKLSKMQLTIFDVMIPGLYEEIVAAEAAKETEALSA